MYIPLRRTAQSALHIMLLSYYIGMCVFHEHQRDMTSVKHNVFLVSGIKTGCLTENRENIFVHGFSCSWGSRGAL